MTIVTTIATVDIPTAMELKEQLPRLPSTFRTVDVPEVHDVELAAAAVTVALLLPFPAAVK